MFQNATSFNQDIGNWNVSQVINMGVMFYNATSFNQNIGNWDVTKVQYMDYMFYNALSFNQDIGSWNVGEVRGMYRMFSGASAFNQNIGSWDVSQVIHMTQMFYFAISFNQDIGNWNVVKVTNMDGIFLGASTFNKDIGNWDVSNVTNMYSIFQNAISFNQDIGNWNVSQVTNMGNMFYNATSFNQNIGNWDVSQVTNMGYMFYNTRSFNQNIGNWNVSQVTNMGGMFQSATAFNQDIGGWNVSQVTNMSRMFYNANSFNQNIENWDVSQVTNMENMFYNATNFNQNIGNWDVSKVTNMYCMFYRAINFNQNIGSWNVSEVTNMAGMFYYTTSFNQDIGNWNVGQVANMASMFYYASSFNQNIENWDVSQVTHMGGMFQNASSFNQDIGNWDVAKVQYMNYMFYNATSFNQDIGSWDVGKVLYMHQIFSGVTLSTENYDNLLIGWSAQNLQPNVNFHGGYSTYCTGAAERQKIIDDFNWNITDGGVAGITLNVENLPDINEPCEVTSITEPTALDCAGNIIIASTAAPLTFTEQGTYTITWTYDDGNENIVTQTQNVIVDDDTSPTVVVQNITLDLGASGNASIVAGDIDNNSSDNCGIATMELSKTAFGCSNVGTNQVTLTVTDVNGNSAAETATVLVNDVTPPTVLTKNISVDLDETGNVSIVAADVDDGSTDACGITSLSVSPDAFTCADVGENTVTLTVTDVNGNSAAGTAIVIVNDVTPPTVLTKNISVDLDETGNVSIVAADVDDGSTDACGITSLSVSPDAFTCADVGENTVTLTVTDVDGNSAAGTAIVIVNDVTPPTVLTKNISVDLDATGNISITAADVDDGSTDACGIASLSVSPDAFTCSEVGTNTVTLTVTDVNGNVAEGAASVTVNDVTQPVVLTKNISVELDATGYASITAADVDDGSADACGIASLSVSPDAFTCADVGENTITLTVIDVNGNVAEGAASVTVNDVTQPVVLTKNISVELDATGNASITAADVDDGSTDACGIASLSVSPDAFTCADVGENTITLTVIDVNGNLAEGAASVTVNDVTQPVVLTKNISVELDATGNASITAADVDDGSTDACGIASLSVSPDAFTCSEVGTNTVTLTVTDVNGNSAAGTATITVNDVTPPTVLTKNISVDLDETGNVSVVAADVDDGSTDACGIATRSLDITSFSCANVGTPVTVELTVIDVNGNFASETADVTVEDKIAPNVVTQNITVQLNATGNITIAENAVDNGSSDACGGLTFDTDITSFDCSNVGVNDVVLTVTDVNGNSATAAATVTVEDVTPPTVLTKNISVDLDETGNVSIVAADVDDGSNDACGIASMSVSPDAFDCSNVGANEVTLTVTDVNGNLATGTATVTVKLRPTTLVINPPFSGQYSDEVILSASLTDNYSGNPIAEKTLQFRLGTQIASAVTEADGTAKTSIIIDQSPGSKNYVVMFEEICPYAAATASETFTVNPEPACYVYTGPVYSATSSATSSKVTLVLTATIYETDDNLQGDISKASVQFYNENAPIGGILHPVPDPNYPSTGYVSLEHTFDIGNSSAENYEVSLKINGCYTNNINCSDPAIINIYKPDGDFITGGGFITELESYGAYAANAGMKTNFGFNVKFNKNGKNLIGKMTVNVRRMEQDGIHIYRFKTNSTQSLGVNPGGIDACHLAEFTSKANLTDVTDPLNPLEITGNLQLRTTLTDCGEPGNNDRIGITIWNSDILLFSSNWNGTETVEQVLDGGNLRVHSSSGINENKSGDVFNETLLPNQRIDVQLYPNPSTGLVNIDFGSFEISQDDVLMMSITGEEVFRQAYLKTNKVLVDLKDQKTGVYMVRLEFDGMHVYKKIILKK